MLLMLLFPYDTNFKMLLMMIKMITTRLPKNKIYDVDDDDDDDDDDDNKD